MPDTGAPESKRIRMVVSGVVQGVCFRYHTRGEASRLGLLGWVRNRPDGSVEILAEGPPERLNELVVWAQRGPPSARVERVSAEYEPLQGDLGPFRIAFAEG